MYMYIVDCTVHRHRVWNMVSSLIPLANVVSYRTTDCCFTTKFLQMVLQYKIAENDLAWNDSGPNRRTICYVRLYWTSYDLYPWKLKIQTRTKWKVRSPFRFLSGLVVFAFFAFHHVLSRWQTPGRIMVSSIFMCVSHTVCLQCHNEKNKKTKFTYINLK